MSILSKQKITQKAGTRQREGVMYFFGSDNIYDSMAEILFQVNKSK